jgi:molybdopterin-containing oxidoreductase family iron-sulfur binding subunit
MKNTYRWGMVIDLDKCTGCQACVVACRQENNVPAIGEENARLGRGKFWMNLIVEVKGSHPEVEMHFIPMPCMHCDRPPCTKVCPVAATYKNPEGIVAQVYPRCIGVACAFQLSYTVRYFNWYPHMAARVREGLNRMSIVGGRESQKNATFVSRGFGGQRCRQ